MASAPGPIRVLHFGLGPIGLGVVRQVAERKGFKIVGAVDIDPAKVGRDLGEVAGLGRPLRVKVSDDAKKAIKASKPDVVVLCTSSSLKKVLPQIETVLKLKVPIVSTTEELAYPTSANLRYARAIHQLAKKAKVAVLGHRRESRVRDGRAADHADRRLRARRSGPRRSRSRTRASGGCRSSRRSAPASRASSSSGRSTTGACGTSGWRSRSR